MAFKGIINLVELSPLVQNWTATKHGEFFDGKINLIDTVSYVNSNVGVNINLTKGYVFGGYAKDGTINISEGWGPGAGSYIPGNEDNNVIYGSSGNDIILGMDGDDWLYGGYGNDRLIGGNGNDKLYGGWGDDVFHSKGSGIFDEYYGNMGDDTFFLGYDFDGSNYVYGGVGIDTVDYSFSTLGVAFALTRGTFFLDDRFESIENGRGSHFLDEIHGSGADNYIEGLGGNDYLLGKEGNDRLEGGSGNDRLDGGAGFDSLFGGSGADTFIFTDYDDTTNISEEWGDILDFNGTQGDKIDLSETTDNGLDYIGNAAFSGTGDGEVRVVHNDFNNETTVYIDINGDGIANGEIDVQLVSSFSSFGEGDFIL